MIKIKHYLWGRHDIKISGTGWDEVVSAMNDFEERGYVQSRKMYETLRYRCNVKMKRPQGQLEKRMGDML
jgi:hypothetical protein